MIFARNVFSLAAILVSSSCLEPGAALRSVRTVSQPVGPAGPEYGGIIPNPGLAAPATDSHIGVHPTVDPFNRVRPI